MGEAEDGECALRMIRDKKPDIAQIACEECGQFITPAFSMSISQLAAYTKKKYGKQLCAECAKAIKEKEGSADGAAVE